MALTFAFGVNHTHDELSVMQSGGCYWVNVERQEDARRLCRQTLVAQSAATRAALVCCGVRPGQLVAELPVPEDRTAGPPARLALFTLPEKKSALHHILSDLMRALNATEHLIIFFLPASIWKDFSQAEMEIWLCKTCQWLIKCKATFLIISYGSGISYLKNTLASQFSFLSGLASVQSLQDCARYQISWWFNGQGVIANQAVTWEIDKQDCFIQSVLLPGYSPSVSDEQLFLAEKGVLEGAPPLSANWRLLEDNRQVAEQGSMRHSATLVFALSESEQVAALAQQIHALRRQRGITLKIVVREMKASLRYTDERLLQVCGANLVVPYITPLSRFLTMLESIQGQRFTRHVPATIDSLLAAVTPSRIKGPVSNETFCRVVPLLIENPLMPEDDKGILLALRPVPGLSPQQAISLCRLRRGGDLVTATALRLYLFLSNCRITDLDNVLEHLFRLPVSDAFSNRLIWTHDVQILSEIKLLRKSTPSTESTAAISQPINAAGPAARPPAERRRPVPLILALQPDQEGRP